MKFGRWIGYALMFLSGCLVFWIAMSIINLVLK